MNLNKEHRQISQTSNLPFRNLWHGSHSHIYVNNRSITVVTVITVGQNPPVVSIRTRTNSHVIFVTNDRLRYDHCYCLVLRAFFSLHIVPKIGIVSNILTMYPVRSMLFVRPYVYTFEVAYIFSFFLRHLIFYIGGFVWDFYSYYIQHCFICRPSDSTVPTNAGI